MINAGRVLIIPKGEWTNLESYEMLDLVTRGDIAYIARQASVGVDPATDTQLTYWQPFGTAAKIATTTTPGLVMPDGTTVTIDATGLISANIGISDINNVTITSISNGQILQYNSSTQRWENKSLGSAALRNATSSITSGSTDLIESGAVNSLKQTLENKHKVTSFKVNTSGWTTNTSMQSGTTLYKKSIALSRVYADVPTVDIGASGVLPTSAEQTAYDLLRYASIDGTTLYLYASAIPTTAFYINVEGVD